MNVLLLLDRVPPPDECARTCVDTDWLLDLAAIHDLTVAVDEASPALQPLRDADVTVHVSDKRTVYLPGGRLADADESFANWVAGHHAARPFDLVVAAPERPLLDRVRATLPGVPWAVLAAAGPTAAAQRLSVESAWLDEHGHQLWFAASNVAAADVVASPVDPAVLGLEVPHQDVATLVPVPEPDLVHHVGGELVAVVATGVSRADATWAVERALDAIDVRAGTTVVVLHAPPIHGAEPVVPALVAGVPDDLEQQVVLVPTNREGNAAAWLDVADGLVLADSSELLIPTVARRAAVLPTVVLGSDPEAGARTTSLLTAAPQRPPDAPGSGGSQLLQWTSPPQVAAELRSLRGTEGLDLVVLHDEGAVGEATRWMGLQGLDRYDVVLGAAELLPWGMPDLERLDSGLVGLHRRTWPVLIEQFAAGLDLADVVGRLGDLAGARSHTIGMVTSERELDAPVAPQRTGQALTLTGGPLRDLRLTAPQTTTSAPAGDSATTTATEPDALQTASDRAALRTWVRETPWQERARLALPWRFGLADAIKDGQFPDGVERWVRDHGIADRARLLLPWKWGVLPRAMEGRW